MTKEANELEGYDVEVLLDRFYDYYCSESMGLPKEALVKLQEDGIICIKVVRNYLVVKDYMEALQRHSNYSMKAAEETAVKFGMTSRQIQNIIYKWENRFRKLG